MAKNVSKKTDTEGAESTTPATETTQEVNAGQTQEVQSNAGESAGEDHCDSQGQVAELDHQDKAGTAGTQGDNLVGGVSEAAAKDALPTEEPESVTDKRDKLVREVFAKQSRFHTVYVTSDLVPFFEKNNALRHAQTLNDKHIVEKHRNS